MTETAMEQALAELARFHEEVDREAAALAARLPGGLACGPGCAACCVDDLRVFEVEAERIRLALPLGLRPNPKGACALLDPASSLCRVYAARPYVCRTQGLPLRWLDEGEDGEVVERRDICPENDEAVALLELDPEACWTIGPFEGRLAEMQRRLDGGLLRRVPLRGLLGRGRSPG